MHREKFLHHKQTVEKFSLDKHNLVTRTTQKKYKISDSSETILLLFQSLSHLVTTILTYRSINWFNILHINGFT